MDHLPQFATPARCRATRWPARSSSCSARKIYVIAQDYAFGHALHDGLAKAAAKVGGTIIGDEFFPLGTTDYSAVLIKARAANPDVLVDLAAGDDGINSIKQAVQFGLDKQVHIAGMQQELEVIEGLPPEARIGTWLFEWYWKQPERAACRRFRGCDPQDDRQGADGADVVRIMPRSGAARWSPTRRRRSMP